MRLCCQAVCAKCDRLLDCMGLDKLNLRTAYLGEKGKAYPLDKGSPQEVLTPSSVRVIPGRVLWSLVVSVLRCQYESFEVGGEKHTAYRPEVRYGRVAPL